MDDAFADLDTMPRKTRGAKRAKKTHAGSDARSFVDQVIGLEDRKKRIGAELKEVLEAAKMAGHNPRAIKIVAHHAVEDEDEQAARIALAHEIEAIKTALGDFADSPLGAATLSRAH